MFKFGLAAQVPRRNPEIQGDCKFFLMQLARKSFDLHRIENPSHQDSPSQNQLHSCDTTLSFIFCREQKSLNSAQLKSCRSLIRNKCSLLPAALNCALTFKKASSHRLYFPFVVSSMGFMCGRPYGSLNDTSSAYNSRQGHLPT
jgi:hypothetical protein